MQISFLKSAVVVASVVFSIAISGCTMAQSDRKENPVKPSEVPQGKMEIKPGPVDKSEKVSPGKIDADAPETFTETKSGLKYRILRKSEGKKPKATDSVTVHYKGWLDNGKIFDSSYRRNSKASFPLARVIPGWTEGLQLVGVDGMIELEIPYTLGYGLQGSPPDIPPKATLHFIVELYKIGG